MVPKREIYAIIKKSNKKYENLPNSTAIIKPCLNKISLIKKKSYERIS